MFTGRVVHKLRFDRFPATPGKTVRLFEEQPVTRSDTPGFVQAFPVVCSFPASAESGIGLPL